MKNVYQNKKTGKLYYKLTPSYEVKKLFRTVLKYQIKKLFRTVKSARFADFEWDKLEYINKWSFVDAMDNYVKISNKDYDNYVKISNKDYDN